MASFIDERKPIIKITGEISQAEVDSYTAQILEEHRDLFITEIDIAEDGEYVNCSYRYSDVPFERIRRITGYLVGTLDRFNNAKRAEVQDRVKHSL